MHDYQPLEKTSVSFQVVRKRYLLLCALVFFTVVLYNFLTQQHITTPEYEVVEYSKIKRSRVIVASEFSHHFDVHLAAASTLRKVLGPDGDVRVFAHTPLRHGFMDVVDALDLFDKEIESPDNFIRAMSIPTPISQDTGEESLTDLVLFGTCEVDMDRWSDELLEVWDARPEKQKFIVVCIVHHFGDTRWQRHITPWAARGSIRLLPIAYHVGRSFRAHFQELADSPERDMYTSLYEYIPIDVHVPILSLSDYGQRRMHSTLSRAVIQGNFQIDRRDYPHIFADLIDELQKNAELWGYRPLTDGSEVYEPLPASNAVQEPFELHLVGDGQLDVPRPLEKVVFIHNGLTYFDFYALMQSMDVVIPAFVNRDYYDFQASSTVAMAIQCNVPILASQRMRKAYGYIDDDRVTITRPQALREISALGVLRQAASRSGFMNGTKIRYGNYSSSEGLMFQSDKFERGVDEMIHQGWHRDTEGFEIFKLNLWEKNGEAIRRILNDLPGEI